VKRKTPKAFQLRSTRLVDYRLLGLQWGESDVIKIRDSVTASINGQSKKNKLHRFDAGPERSAKVALAGYRLLDPRFRRQLYDRVQLSFLIYRELDEQPRDKQNGVRLPLISSEYPNRKFELSSVLGIDSPDRSIAEDDNDKFVVLVDSNSDSTLDAYAFHESSIDNAREVVRMIHEAELKDKSDAISTSAAVSRWLHSAIHASFQVAMTVSKKTLSAAFHGTGAWYLSQSDKPDQLAERE